jgi:hypothetical protein
VRGVPDRVNGRRRFRSLNGRDIKAPMLKFAVSIFRFGFASRKMPNVDSELYTTNIRG